MSADTGNFWQKHSGIKATHQEVAEAVASEMAARALIDTTALTAEQVAARLNLPVSTVLLHAADRELYSYSEERGRKFPEWQFTAAGRSVIPSLGSVLAALPVDLHPRTVAGFFLTTQPDLVSRGTPVSAKEWLEAGMPIDPVVQLAASLKSEC